MYMYKFIYLHVQAKKCRLGKIVSLFFHCPPSARPMPPSRCSPLRAPVRLVFPEVRSPCSTGFWFPKSLESWLRLSLVYCNTKDNPLQTSGLPINVLLNFKSRDRTAPKIALMSNLPQVFTDRIVWFIFHTIVDKLVTKNGVWYSIIPVFQTRTRFTGSSHRHGRDWTSE
jgi:hypothetical protein